MNVTTRNRLIIGAVFVLVGAYIGYQMFFSMTPARHADHDHAIAKIDAGGYLWIEGIDGKRRNLVGRPGKVLVLHWFDPTAQGTLEQSQAARFATRVADDPLVEVVLVAQAPSWAGIEDWIESAGVPRELVYLDENGRTGDLFGVRRLPETLIYDPQGVLAFQAKGPMDWSGPAIEARITTAKSGVEEIA
jgi:hypothetical protein